MIISLCLGSCSMPDPHVVTVQEIKQTKGGAFRMSNGGTMIIYSRTMTLVKNIYGRRWLNSLNDELYGVKVGDECRLNKPLYYYYK